MHREFRKLLGNATGRSEFVVAINVDIRGFSSFSTTVESTDVAMFIKRVYMKLIDNYFPDASFYKPAGDGLLIIIPYTEKSLKQVATQSIRICLKVLKHFGSFCIKDPMINFKVPKKVGIGLSRGSVSSLVSDDKTLDYSGKALNLASRLMDLARPSGIVFDANFDIKLLPDKLRKLFTKEAVYLSGMAELEPIYIYFTKESTQISPLSKHPIGEIKWKTIGGTKKLKEIKESDVFFYYLTSKPLDVGQIKIIIDHPKIVGGKKRTGLLSSFDFIDFKYSLEAGKARLAVNYSALAKLLVERGVKDRADVYIKIVYPEKPV